MGTTFIKIDKEKLQKIRSDLYDYRNKSLDSDIDKILFQLDSILKKKDHLNDFKRTIYVKMSEMKSVDQLISRKLYDLYQELKEKEISLEDARIKYYEILMNQ